MRSSFGLSLIFHTLFLTLCYVLSLQNVWVSPPKEPLWIELDPIVSKKQKMDDRKQIVQTDLGEKVAQAPDQALLGEVNQRVEKETVGKARHLKEQQRGQQPKQANATQEQGKKRAKVALSALGLPTLLATEAKVAKESPQWANVGSIPQDYVRGVSEGERTLLNTKEYVFFGYFQRIRERLDRAWVPLLREKISGIYRRGRSLASDMEHATKVLVTLNKGGEIVRVQVLSESGSRDLDDAAINAFNQAGPFPNPPKGIVDPNGEIEIPWEFILKT